MKMIGMLIVLGGVLAMGYFIAQDMGYLSEGGYDRATMDITGTTGKVMDSLQESREQLKRNIDNAE